MNKRIFKPKRLLIAVVIPILIILVHFIGSLISVHIFFIPHENVLVNFLTGILVVMSALCCVPVIALIGLLIIMLFDWIFPKDDNGGL